GLPLGRGAGDARQGCLVRGRYQRLNAAPRGFVGAVAASLSPTLNLSLVVRPTTPVPNRTQTFGRFGRSPPPPLVATNHRPPRRPALGAEPPGPGQPLPLQKGERLVDVGLRLVPVEVVPDLRPGHPRRHVAEGGEDLVGDGAPGRVAEDVQDRLGRVVPAREA